MSLEHRYKRLTWGHRVKLLCSPKLYMSAFVSKNYSLNTFGDGVEDFGIILKGKSVEKLPTVAAEFDNCFIVNNFDPEMEVVGDSLLNKNIVHFVCRTMTTPLLPENYRKLNIREVQLSKATAAGDRALMYAISYYRSLGLRTVFLPKKLFEVSTAVYGDRWSGVDKKFPNTGHLAIYYALKYIQPRRLWIVGLDFYKSDYLMRRSHLTPLEKQRNKMKSIDAVNVVQNWIREHPDVQFNIVTYFDGLEQRPNLRIL